MTVYDVVSACEYVNCDIVDFWGFDISCTKENCDEIYKKTVEHLEAKGSRIIIFTFDNIDKRMPNDNHKRGM